MIWRELVHRWMSEKGYSVRLAKQQIRLLQAEARKECSEAIAKDTGMMLSFILANVLPRWNA